VINKAQTLKRKRVNWNVRQEELGYIQQGEGNMTITDQIRLFSSGALSMRAIASYMHLAMSSSATTSPFSTTGKCLNLPETKGFLKQTSRQV
jgi:hypothetical protein